MEAELIVERVRPYFTQLVDIVLKARARYDARPEPDRLIDSSLGRAIAMFDGMAHFADLAFGRTGRVRFENVKKLKQVFFGNKEGNLAARMKKADAEKHTTWNARTHVQTALRATGLYPQLYFPFYDAPPSQLFVVYTEYDRDILPPIKMILLTRESQYSAEVLAELWNAENSGMGDSGGETGPIPMPPPPLPAAALKARKKTASGQDANKDRKQRGA